MATVHNHPKMNRRTLSEVRKVHEEWSVVVNPTARPQKISGHEMRVWMDPYEIQSDTRCCIRKVKALTADLMKANNPAIEIMTLDRGDRLLQRWQDFIDDEPEWSVERAFKAAWKEVTGWETPSIDDETDAKRREERALIRLRELNISPRPGWTVDWMEMIGQDPRLQYEDPATFLLKSGERLHETAAEAAAKARSLPPPTVPKEAARLSELLASGVSLEDAIATIGKEFAPSAPKSAREAAVEAAGERASKKTKTG